MSDPGLADLNDNLIARAVNWPADLLVRQNECRFVLTWRERNYALDQNAIKATLNYLRDTTSTAAEAKYVVHGAIETTSNFRVAEIACRDVPARDASRVSAIMGVIPTGGHVFTRLLFQANRPSALQVCEI